MNDVTVNGVILTKDYKNEFDPWDLQFGVSEIADDFTLYDLFDLVRHAATIIPGIYAAFGMKKFFLFWDQINQPRKNMDKDLTHIELYWEQNYGVKEAHIPGKPKTRKTFKDMMDNYTHYETPFHGELGGLMGVHGVGSGCPEAGLFDHECNKDCSDEKTWAIEFTPLNDLAHLPIKMSTTINFHPPYISNADEYRKTGFTMEIYPTLYTLITSILFELTFMGSTPNQVYNKMEDLRKTVEEAKEWIEKESEENGS